MTPVARTIANALTLPSETVRFSDRVTGENACDVDAGGFDVDVDVGDGGMDVDAAGHDVDVDAADHDASDHSSHCGVSQPRSVGSSAGLGPQAGNGAGGGGPPRNRKFRTYTPEVRFIAP